MQTQESGPDRLLYYGETVGVLVAWVVGFLVLVTASAVEPVASETERLAEASVVGDSLLVE